MSRVHAHHHHHYGLRPHARFTSCPLLAPPPPRHPHAHSPSHPAPPAPVPSVFACLSRSAPPSWISHSPPPASAQSRPPTCWPRPTSLSSNSTRATPPCDETTSSFSRKSQVLYQTNSDAKVPFLEASTSDVTVKLFSLHTSKDNLILLCTSSIESLAELESKFEEIAEHIGDFSFSRVRSAGRWIFSGELISAPQRRSNRLFEESIRSSRTNSASILQNPDILLSNYQSSISPYRESLAEAVDDFQKIRSSDRTEHTSSEGIGNLDELERRLDDLCLEGLNLERVGRVLCSS